MTKWAYILVFDHKVGTRDEVLKFLDSRQEILNWYACLPNAVFIISNLNANRLQAMFRQFAKDEGRFIIADMDTDSDGWLPKKAWDFIKAKKAHWE